MITIHVHEPIENIKIESSAPKFHVLLQPNLLWLCRQQESANFGQLQAPPWLLLNRTVTTTTPNTCMWLIVYVNKATRLKEKILLGNLIPDARFWRALFRRSTPPSRTLHTVIRWSAEAEKGCENGRSGENGPGDGNRRKRNPHDKFRYNKIDAYFLYSIGNNFSVGYFYISEIECKSTYIRALWVWGAATTHGTRKVKIYESS